MLRGFVLSFLLCFSCFADSSWNEAVSLFQKKQYQAALELFEESITEEQQPTDALMGKLFCQVALGQVNDANATIKIIKKKLEFLLQCKAAEYKPSDSLEEHREAYLCRQKVREVANQMRQTVEQLVRENVPGFLEKIKILRELYPLIDSLEYTALDCCHNQYPSNCCLSPLMKKLEAWNSLSPHFYNSKK